MPTRLRVSALLLAGCLVVAAACGPGVDLERDLAVTDLQTGYYNNGMKDGQHHLLPSVAFRLRNESTHDLTSVQITVQFWQDGADGELDSKPLAGISTHPLKPAAETESFEFAESIELSVLEVAALRLHAGLKPGYALAESEVAAALKVRRNQAQDALGKLKRLNLLETAVGGGGGETAYRLTRAGRGFLVFRRFDKGAAFRSGTAAKPAAAKPAAAQDTGAKTR